MDLPTLDKLVMSDETVGRLNEAVKYLEKMGEAVRKCFGRAMMVA